MQRQKFNSGLRLTPRSDIAHHDQAQGFAFKRHIPGDALNRNFTAIFMQQGQLINCFPAKA